VSKTSSGSPSIESFPEQPAPSNPDGAPDRNELRSYSSCCRRAMTASENLGLDMRATGEPFDATSWFPHDWCVWMLP